ncbi:hypothetical protein [Candidatus Electronema sp. JM]|uniref:hypothetical protein n=1 Tax=Candidatus Electronema sp. JM TaxID=3401571 RepID=UPI003AA949C2
MPETVPHETKEGKISLCPSFGRYNQVEFFMKNNIIPESWIAACPCRRCFAPEDFSENFKKLSAHEEQNICRLLLSRYPCRCSGGRTLDCRPEK